VDAITHFVSESARNEPRQMLGRAWPWFSVVEGGSHVSMLRLEYGRSYLWLFFVYIVLFFGGVALCEAVGRVNWGIFTMPAFLAFLLLCEFRSGVALDSWWRARYLKGRWQYRATLAWHCVGMLLLSLLSYVFNT